MTNLEAYYQWLILNRIACPEAGYPASEALYGTLLEFIEHQPHSDDAIPYDELRSILT